MRVSQRRQRRQLVGGNATYRKCSKAVYTGVTRAWLWGRPGSSARDSTAADKPTSQHSKARTKGSFTLRTCAGLHCLHAHSNPVLNEACENVFNVDSCAGSYAAVKLQGFHDTGSSSSGTSYHQHQHSGASDLHESSSTIIARQKLSQSKNKAEDAVFSRGG